MHTLKLDIASKSLFFRNLLIREDREQVLEVVTAFAMSDIPCVHECTIAMVSGKLQNPAAGVTSLLMK